MNDPATGNWIVYNGEIYNFREVRAKLSKRDSNSSVTPTPKSFSKPMPNGGEMPSEFRGMFAFAIWDSQQKHCCWPAILWESSRYTTTVRIDISCFLGSSHTARNRPRAEQNRSAGLGELHDLWLGSTTQTRWSKAYAPYPGSFLTWERRAIKQLAYWDLVEAGG